MNLAWGSNQEWSCGIKELLYWKVTAAIGLPLRCQHFQIHLAEPKPKQFQKQRKRTTHNGKATHTSFLFWGERERKNCSILTSAIYLVVCQKKMRKQKMAKCLLLTQQNRTVTKILSSVPSSFYGLPGDKTAKSRFWKSSWVSFHHQHISSELFNFNTA